ncbi:hypothetical protein F4808DRAFT_71959 [Astrocystis sublimbata]|nr:hypothetical protein F4808DRAFT_71959 [Astrocystis sublimbata]
MSEFEITMRDRVTTVHFGQATPDQLAPCRKLAGAEFGKPLDIQEYLEQESYLDQKPLVRDGRCHTWCLSLAHHPTEVLATCKTILREILVKEYSGVSWQTAYCIACVATDPRYRGQGLASQLLKNVSQWLDGPGQARASVLYTSIGDFYDRRGWKKVAAYQTSLSWPPDLLVADRRQLPSTRPITNLEIPGLCDRDVKDVESRIDSLLPQLKELHLCVLPTANLITWLHDRSDFVGTKLKGAPPQSHGSICNSADCWLYWYHDFRKGRLAVQRIRMPDETDRPHGSAVAAMLLDAIEEARTWDLAQVIIWEPSSLLLDAISLLRDIYNVQSDTRARIDKSVSSIRWMHGDETTTTIVHFNEFYAWS